MIILQLFISFLKIGFFAFGGAHSFIPLIEKEVVTKYGWLSREEFLDILGFNQVLPGAISIKYATYVGYKMGGIIGMLVTNMANILPPALLIIGLTSAYKKYRDIPSVAGAFDMIRVAVFSMIIGVAFRLIGFKSLLSLKYAFLALVFLIIFLATKLHPAFIILGAGIIGAIKL
mgnify:CR=1 FL=1